LTIYKLNINANIVPHPPSDDGKDVICNALNVFLNKMSSAIKDNVDVNAMRFFLVDDDLFGDDDDDDADDILSDDVDVREGLLNLLGMLMMRLGAIFIFMFMFIPILKRVVPVLGEKALIGTVIDDDNKTTSVVIIIILAIFVVVVVMMVKTMFFVVVDTSFSLIKKDYVI
jgi:hypothetical protein